MAPDRFEERPGASLDGEAPWSELTSFLGGPPSRSPDRCTAVSEFEEVFRTHYDPMRLYLVRRGVPIADADMVVTDAFMGLWRFWEKHGRPHNPASLLQLVVKRRLSDYFREERRRAEFTTVLGEEAMSKAVVTDSSSSLEVEEQLRELVALLPDRQAEVLLLRVQGLSESEIGAQLGIGAKTVSAHLHRARRTARMFLGAR